ncbi:Scr1 family TA system antitoxin-like transcriptional regulator [Spirillospora sp. NPDC048911]|uniref:helix-turn-helix domain-containing protein n=1 Tax=Spirillospora sp. NPDC048911 TaxID=3364527 RepID=UPI00371594CF
MNRKKLQPTKSAKTHYGHRLRKYRDKKGWSQPQLAEKVFCTGDLISKIETGVNTATPDMSRRFDVLFELDEEFEDLQELAAEEGIPLWFRPYVEFERKATCVRVFDPLDVPGLLQNEAYARTILSSRYEGDELDEAVAARLSRQLVLARKRPPWVLVLVSEWALRRPIGNPEAQRGQLRYLLDLGKRRNITIQVVPIDACIHPSGAFTLFSFADEPDIAYVDSVRTYGRPLARHEEVEDLKVEFDRIRSEALSVNETVAVIQAVLEDL